MNKGFIEELETLLSGKLTGTIVLHCHEGAIKQYEVNERRRPKADQVELTEAGKGR